jgi:uncharacterized protein YwgA
MDKDFRENRVGYFVEKLQNPCKKKLQKMVYLTQELEGLKLGFDYDLHFYGPYSAQLNGITSKLAAEGIIKFDYEGYSHLMSITDDAKKAVAEDAADIENETKESINNILSCYETKTASELELLATTLYVIRYFDNTQDTQKILAGVHKIKGEKYKDSQIKQSINELKSYNENLFESKVLPASFLGKNESIN